MPYYHYRLISLALTIMVFYIIVPQPPKGVHYLLQTRTAVLNNELQDKFASWYPGCTIDEQSGGKLSAMAA
ncbi:hypothetical protein EXO80_24955 [Salmonella enterica]|nr:hypothetical protein [Salmonella enterica]ECH1725667.1 hypothetical protein [Salmonella enterica]